MKTDGDGVVFGGTLLQRLTQATSLLALAATLILLVDVRSSVPIDSDGGAEWVSTVPHASRPGFATARKFVVFALYGDRGTDLDGALENAAAVPLYYLSWTAMFVVDPTVPAPFRDRLREAGAVVVAVAQNVSDWGDGRRLLRFLALGDGAVQYALFRDATSRISAREIAAVNAWLGTNRTFHIMRDHPRQTVVLPAGMWGVHAGALRTRLLVDVAQSIERYVHGRGLPYPPPGTDQGWLQDVIWPLIGPDDAVIHDAFHCGGGGEVRGRPFPLPRDYHGDFVGLVQDTTATESAIADGYLARWLEYRRHGAATFSTTAPDVCRLQPQHLYG